MDRLQARRRTADRVGRLEVGSRLAEVVRLHTVLLGVVDRPAESHVSHALESSFTTSMMHEHILHNLRAVLAAGMADSGTARDCTVAAAGELGYMAQDCHMVAPGLDMSRLGPVVLAVVEAGASIPVELANRNRQAPATGNLAAVVVDIGIDHQVAAAQVRLKVGPGLQRRVSRLTACVRGQMWIFGSVVVGGREEGQRMAWMM